MDITWIKSILDKIFWPLVCIYILYLLFKLYQYFSGMKYVVDKDFYNQFYVNQFLVVFVIMAFGLILKIWGQDKIASLTLAIPAGITFVMTLLTLLVWIFLAIVFILFGNK